MPEAFADLTLGRGPVETDIGQQMIVEVAQLAPRTVTLPLGPELIRQVKEGKRSSNPTCCGPS